MSTMSLNIPMPTAADINSLTYLGAAKFKEEMSRPGGQPEKLDFSLMATCFGCGGAVSQTIGQKVPNLSSGMHVACLLVLNSRWYVQDASPPFTVPKRYVSQCLGIGPLSAAVACSVKSRIGKPGGLARKVTSFSARKTRWVRIRSGEM